MMTLENALDVRRSRRAYVSVPMEPAAVEILSTLLSSMEKEVGLTMPLVLENGGAFEGLRRSYGMFSGVRNYVGLIESKADPFSKEKLGYYGELFVLRATMLGLGTCWVGGTFDRKSCPFTLSGDQSIAGVITVGPVQEALTTKERLLRGLVHRKSKTIEQMTDADAPLPEYFVSGMTAVQKAPSAVMRQPVTFSFREGNVCALVQSYENAASALDFGIAKLHFEIGAGGGAWAWGNGQPFARGESPWSHLY